LLDGGRGSNTLAGGAGKDLFVVHRRQAGSDVISHFEAARGERVNLVGFTGKTFTDLLLKQQGKDVKVELGNGQSLLLKDQPLAGVSAANFSFQDTFIAPLAYTSSDTSTHQPQEGLGTVILNGGGKGVMLSSDAQGRMVFKLNGKVYSHDSAASNVFVVADQPGVKNYQNALRGFRHGVDKIDLRQTGITDFSQLNVTQTNRGTINGLSQIHGVEVSFKGGDESDAMVKLLYLDALETSQLDAADFLFAAQAPDVVPMVTPLVTPLPEPPTLAVADPVTPVAPVTPVDPVISELPPLVIDKPLALPVEIIPVKPMELAPAESMQIEWTPIPKIDSSKWERIELIPIEPISFKRPKWVEPISVKPNVLEPIKQNISPDPPVAVPELKPEGIPLDANSIRIKKSFADLTLGDESQTISVEAFGSTLVAGNGDNKVKVSGSWSKITLGHGNNLVVGDIDKLTVGDGNNTVANSGTFTKVTLGNGNNRFTSSGSFTEVTLGNGNNNITSSESFAEMKLGDGNNSITSSGSFAEVKLGDGNNHVQVSGSMSKIEVGQGVNKLAFKGSMGSLLFGKDITPDRLWFQHKELELQISVIGSKQEVKLQNWYASAPERPRYITAGDNQRLMSNYVENLVQAMAAFVPPTSATLMLGDVEQQRLQPVLAANWH
jgi:Ca2+-binding RTX toxin-like protein